MGYVLALCLLIFNTRIFANKTPLIRVLDALRKIYRAEGIRGLYKGSLLALVGVSNGSIQFATYEAIKRRWTDTKRRLYETQGKGWRVEDEKLVSGKTFLSSMRCRCDQHRRGEGMRIKRVQLTEYSQMRNIYSLQGVLSLSLLL
jgi:hypothetical protein